MFLVILTYKKPIKEIEHVLPEHIQFLNHYYAEEKFVFSGRQNPITGGVILMNTQDRDEALAIAREDPFYQKELADYELIEFIPTHYDERFSVFIS